MPAEIAEERTTVWNSFAPDPKSRTE